MVEFCRGYPVEGYAKSNIDSCSSIASALAESKIDQVSIQGSHQPVDPKLSESFGEKTVIYGLVDIGKPGVEPVSEIGLKIMRILGHVEPGRLVIDPNYGMVFLDPDTA